MKISLNLFLRLLDVGVSVGFMCRGSCLCSWMSPLRDGVLGVCGERETVCEAHHPLGPGGPYGLLLWRISIKAVLQHDPVYRDDSFL